MEQGYVVTRPFAESNIGSNLASLAGALYLAHRLSRTLIVDWRGLTQLADTSINYFSAFFDTPGELTGVPVLYAPLADLDYDEGSEDSAWLTPDDAARLARSQAGAPPFVVLQPYHGPDRLHPGPESARFGLLRAFYRELALAPRLAAATEEWARAHLAAPFVVAVNVRTGNGAYFAAGDRYHRRVDVSVFDDRARFLRVLERACRSRLRAVPRSLRNDFQVFYATDSAEMSGLLARLPNAVTKRELFPPGGTGDTFRDDHAEDTNRRSVEATLADMFLLARCDALVFNNSMFNQYARVVTGFYGGNMVHFESLFLRGRIRHLVARAQRVLR
jgi:Nodulation protein Z (NodZ)